LVVFRNGTNDTLTAPIDTNGILGIYQSGSDYVLADYTFWTALHYGTSDAIELLYANIKGMGHIFSGKENAKELSGPIGIAKMFGGEWIWERFWKLVGLISLILAFMNILPIPALDGGHVILLIYEMITRKAIPDKVMEKIQMVGVIILLLLMVLIFGNDIFKIFN
ncbi:MAG: M50 family metallopeptidase, partial [Bacteroidota bacterium]